MKKNKRYKAAYGINASQLTPYLQRVSPRLNYDPTSDRDRIMHDNTTLVSQLDAAKYGNPIANVLGDLSNIAITSGINKIGSGLGTITGNAVGGNFGNVVGNTLSQGIPAALNYLNFTSMYPFGGIVPDGVPVEIEGEETVQYPNGDTVQFEGPDHSAGGIDLNLPPGSTVFSKRIKKDGVSFADRKAKRERNINKIGNRTNQYPYDNLLKTTYSRTESNNAIADNIDLSIQNIIRTEKENEGKIKAAYGYDDPPKSAIIKYDENGNPIYADGFVGLNGTLRSNMNPYDLDEFVVEVPKTKYQLPIVDQKIDLKTFANDMFKRNPNIGPINANSLPRISVPRAESSSNKSFSNYFSNIEDYLPTVGTLLGIYGQSKGLSDQFRNTEQSRANTLPNINAYTQYGIAGLNALNNAERYIESSRLNALNNNRRSESAAISRNRNTARGINTLRALDLITDQAYRNQENAINNAYDQQNLNLALQRSNKLDMRDRMYMTGEQQRDLANRQDTDNYYTQRGINLKSLFDYYQNLAGMINSYQQNIAGRNIINGMSPYGFRYNRNGKLKKS